MNSRVVVSTKAAPVTFASPAANEVWPSLEVVKGDEPARAATAAGGSAGSGGDGDGVSAGLVRYLPRLRRLADRLAANKAAAEDLLHDTLLRALERSSQYRVLPGANVFSWASRILRSLHCERGRKRRREVLVAEFDSHADDRAADQVALWRRIDDDALTAAVSRLPRVLRQAYTLFVEGHCYEVIAKRLGIPTGTVGARIYRAREQLREALLQGAHGFQGAASVVPPSAGLVGNTTVIG
jgi:RNA polymerase sigma-70 factor (ECF subfamily)